MTKAKEDDEVDVAAEEELIMTMGRLLDIQDAAEVVEVVEIYVNTVELILSRFPNLNRRVTIDWALAYAMSKGEWYGESLTTRMQNAMVVSALLLTVTATFFISPPVLGVDEARVFSYACGLSSLLFMLSIVFGICFIENAMSRAFGKSERFILIMKQYTIMNVSQICAYTGAIAFPCVLIIPIRSNYNLTDSVILIIIFVIGFVALLIIQTITVNQAGTEQSRRIEAFEPFVDDQAQLLVKYYPKSAKFQPVNGRFVKQKKFHGPLSTVEIELRENKNILQSK